MSTQLRDIFDAVAESEVPNGIAERAVGAARQRRRQRYVVGGAALATAAVVLGVFVAVSDVRRSVEPKPSDVASIPDVLPSPKGLPSLAAGVMEFASVAYIVDGQLVVVDAATGEAAKVPLDDLVEQPAALSVNPSFTDVALSPDGRRAVATVAGSPTSPAVGVRVLDLEEATEQVLEGVTPVDDVGGVTVRRPSVYAWANDSQSFSCACSWDGLLPSGRSVSQLYDVTLTSGSPEISLSSSATDISPPQVARGTAGTFAQEGETGPWWPPASLADQVQPIEGYALALERGEGSTYLVMRGSRFVLGDLSDSATSSGIPLPSAPSDSLYSVATEVEAAVDGFVVVVAIAQRGEQFQHPGEAIESLRAIFIGPDGSQFDVTRFPNDTVSSSFASDLLEIAGPEVESTLPAELPSTAGLPTLLSGDSINASAAYAVDGHLVVIDEATGDGYLVDLTVGNDMQEAVVGEGAEIHLSPDGQYVLLTRGQGVASARAEDLLWLVDLNRGLARRQAYEVVDAEELGSTPPSRIAWAPDGEQFAMLGANSFGAPDMVQLFDLNEMDEHLNLGGGTIVAVSRPTQIVWGSTGLLGQFDELDGNWAWLDVQADVTDLNEADPREFEPLQVTSRMPADRILLSPHSNAYVEWSDIGLIEAFQGDTALTLQVGQRWFTGSWVDDGPIVVLQDRAFEANERREVSFFVTDGTGGSVAGLFPISTLPPGTVAASFAAHLVDAQQVNG